MFSVKIFQLHFFIFWISINDLSEQVRFSSYNWQAKVRWIPQDDKITQYFDMIRMVFRCIYDRNLNNFYLCHKIKRTMAPLSMLKADIVWLNHINCLLMVFILEILHIVIRIQRQEIKKMIWKDLVPHWSNPYKYETRSTLPGAPPFFIQ